MNVVNLISSLLLSILDILLISYYFQAKYQRKDKNNKLISFLCIIVLTITNYFFVTTELPSLFINMIIIFIVSQLHVIKIKESVISTLLILFMKVFIEIIIVFLFEWIFDQAFVKFNFYLDSLLKIILIFVFKYIQYVILFSSFHFQDQNKVYNFRNFKIYTIILSFIISYIFVHLSLIASPTNYQLLKLLIATVLIYNIAFLMFLFVEKEYKKTLRENDSYQMKLKSDIMYDSIQQKDYKETQQIKHNMKTEYTHMLLMLENEDYEKAKQHIRKLYHDICTKITKSYSGKRYIDASIDRNFKRIKDNLKVEPQYDIGMVNYGIVDDLDISLLLECALRNAYEALEKVNEEDRKLSLEIKNAQANYLCFKITNTTHSTDKILFDVTSKIYNTNEHGYGVKTIKDIAAKYQGQAYFDQEGYVVTLRVILPCI